MPNGERTRVLAELAEWVRLVRVSDVQAAGLFAASIDGIELVVVDADGAVKVFEGRCPHRGTLLGEGSLEDGTVVCRGHGWRFDAATGRRMGGGDACLHEFPALIEGDWILVDGIDIQAWRDRTDTDLGDAADTRTLRTVHDLPGPRPLPLLGNAFSLDTKRLHLILEEWRREYGANYSFRLGPTPIVVFSNHEQVNAILRARPGTFRRFKKLEQIVRELGGHGAFSAEGEEWRRYRRLVVEALSTRHLHQFFPTLNTVLGRLKRRWDGAAAAQSIVDVQKDLMRFTVDVTSTLAFGRDMNTLETEGDVIQDHLEKIFPMLGRRINLPFPYWRYVKLPVDRTLDRALLEVSEEIESVIAESRQRLVDHPERLEQPTNFLEAMLAMQAQGDEDFSDEEIAGNIYTMLLAGEDTTANSLAWILHYMALHPGVQQRMQAEVDEVLGDDPAFTDLADVQRLSYIDAVVQESMRLRPVAPILLLTANEDIVVGDIQISKGGSICVLTRFDALTDSYFADAQAFRPQRWLESSASNGAHSPAASIPFGSGPRICPGRNLALLEIKTTLAMVCRHFDLSHAGDPDQVSEIFAFAVMPEGVLMKFSARDRSI